MMIDQDDGRLISAATPSTKLACLVPGTLKLGATATGKLSGKTFVVKDLMALKGHTSSFGHPRWRDTHTVSNATSPVITKLLNGGANLAGLAKMDQLAGSLVGNIGEGEAPLNSLYPDRFTGGSSSGSASAVAAGLADFGIGTDTAGSIRVPAAACGLFGLRPTFGAIKSEGVLPWAASFDVVGILAKDLNLIRDVYDTLCDKPSSAARITKILLPDNCHELVSADAATTIIKAAQELAHKHGIVVQEIDLRRYINQEVGDLFSRLAGRENWQAHGAWIKQNRQYLAPDLQARMKFAEQVASDPEDKIAADLQARKDFKHGIAGQISDDAILVLPIMQDLPPLRSATADELANFRKAAVRLNAVSGLSGLPEVVAPVRSDNSLIYGVGFIGPANADIAITDFLA